MLNVFLSRLNKSKTLYHLLSLIFFFIAINVHVLFIDSTLMPHGLSTNYNKNSQVREISKSFTADEAGTKALVEFDQFAFQEISNHSIPYWNPYTLLGMPFLAEYQWGIFYPLSYIRILLPENSWDYYSYIHILLLSIIVFYLSKKFYRDCRGAFVAAISIFCTGFFLTYLPTYSIVNVVPWGFLLILSSEGLIRSPRNGYSSTGVTLSVYCLGTAGHPTLAIFMTLGAILFLAFRMLFEQSARRAVLRFSVMSSVGILLAAPNIGPFVYYVLGSEGSVITQWWERPPFYSFRHFASFIFPYLFGSINDSAFPSITQGMQPNAGFFWGTPPILFLAFLGAWFATKRRLFALISLALSGLVLSLWGFGVPPFSMLSSFKALARLNPNYVWSFPATVICVLAGYGLVQLRTASVKDISFAIWTYLIFIALMLSYVLYLGMGLGLEKPHLIECVLALLQGLIPGLLWSITVPMMAVLLITRLCLEPNQKLIRKRLIFVLIVLAIGFSGVGYYPSGNPTNHAIVSLSSFIAFIILTISYVYREKRNERHLCLGFTLTALICVGVWSGISNYLFPGLPNRNVVSIKPDYIEGLWRDRLNWRSYGIFREVLTNKLAAYQISSLNNQNALAPIELRQFFHDYLDSYQDTTMFYGVKYNNASDGEPMNQFHIHRKFWDFVGTKYILSPAMLGDARKVLNSEINGYEPVTFEGAHPITIPLIESNDSPFSSFLLGEVDCSKGSFSALQIRLSTYGLIHSGRLFANIFSSEGDLLAKSSLDASSIEDNKIYIFSYEHELCRIPNSFVKLGLGYLKAKDPHALSAWYTAENELIFSRVYSQSNGIRLISPDEGFGARVYENTMAKPRAYTVTKLNNVGDWRSAQEAFSKQQNLREIAYVEGAVTCPINESNSLEPKSVMLKDDILDTAEVTHIESNEIRLDAQVSQSAVLILVDTFAPGWTANVNGIDSPLFRVNGLFRGVCLPNAGSHIISMKYRPPYWAVFSFLPILGILILAYLVSQKFDGGRKLF